MPLFYAFGRSTRRRDAPFALSQTWETDLPLILYQRDDCHLCDLALQVLAGARVPEFESVFIDDDEALEERYGARVPVLRNDDTGAELDWPFDGERLAGFLL
jgi:hypothetical protein